MADVSWLDEREPLPVALLRAPAAVAAGAFVVGVAAGAITGPFVPGASAHLPTELTWVAALAVCAPFIVPTAWYRRHRILWAWMAAAAAFATLRAVFMAGFLLAYQPLPAWTLKVAMDFLAAAVLWTAALAVRRSIRETIRRDEGFGIADQRSGISDSPSSS